MSGDRRKGSWRRSKVEEGTPGLCLSSGRVGSLRRVYRKEKPIARILSLVDTRDTKVDVDEKTEILSDPFVGTVECPWVRLSRREDVGTTRTSGDGGSKCKSR